MLSIFQSQRLIGFWKRPVYSTSCIMSGVASVPIPAKSGCRLNYFFLSFLFSISITAAACCGSFQPISRLLLLSLRFCNTMLRPVESLIRLYCLPFDFISVYCIAFPYIAFPYIALHLISLPYSCVNFCCNLDI